MKGTFMLDGKPIECTVDKTGRKFVNGMNIADFMLTLTLDQLMDFAEIGANRVLNPEKSAMTMHKELQGRKHN